MQWFSALIPAYPDVQRKAQEELDLVVGRERLPTVEDERNLPYCHAIIKEVQLYCCYYSIWCHICLQVERRHNPFWLGTPHVAIEDFVYQGQLIPKGTVIVLNTWTMHHDAIRHPDPLTFNVCLKVIIFTIDPTQNEIIELVAVTLFA